jgi:hypothetical protein
MATRSSGPPPTGCSTSRKHLYYRDSRYFDRRDDKGRKIFWSRGNGWVYAGIVDILKTLPADHPSRPRYEALFRQMSDQADRAAKARRLLGAFPAGARKRSARDQRHRLLRLWPGLRPEPRAAEGSEV